MKNKLALWIFLLPLLFTSCSTIQVAVDYDSQNDFSNYKKYKWIKQKKGDDYKSLFKNEINRKRFATNIESVLNQKGIERTEEGDHDFSIVYHLRFEEKLDVTAYGYKYYPLSGYREKYIQTRVYQQGSIIIDVIDARQKQMVWRGVAEGVLYETENPEEIIKKAVKSILKDFPPNSKK